MILARSTEDRGQRNLRSLSRPRKSNWITRTSIIRVGCRRSVVSSLQYAHCGSRVRMGLKRPNANILS
jgi:hypothetical protein